MQRGVVCADFDAAHFSIRQHMGDRQLATSMGKLFIGKMGYHWGSWYFKAIIMNTPPE